MKLTFDLSEENWPWELCIELQGGGQHVFRGTETPEIPGLTTPSIPEEVPAQRTKLTSRASPTTYDEAFSAKAVALAKAKSLAVAAKELEIPYGTLWKWVRK